MLCGRGDICTQVRGTVQITVMATDGVVRKTVGAILPYQGRMVKETMQRILWQALSWWSGSQLVISFVTIVPHKEHHGEVQELKKPPFS